VTVPEAIGDEETPPVTVDALAADEAGEQLPPIGEEEADVPETASLFDPATTARVVLMQNIVPAIATLGAYLAFRFVPVFGF
jgi:PiT family inorganic phosphate transporter